MPGQPGKIVKQLYENHVKGVDLASKVRPQFSEASVECAGITSLINGGPPHNIKNFMPDTTKVSWSPYLNKSGLFLQYEVDLHNIRFYCYG